MAAPTSYTEATLKTYMTATLGATATALDLVDADFGEAVNETLLAYDVTDIASATNIKKLRALARVQAWITALAEATADYDFSDGGASYKRDQVVDHILKQLELASAQAAEYDPAYTIEVVDVDYVENPYEYHEADDYLTMR